MNKNLMSWKFDGHEGSVCLRTIQSVLASASHSRAQQSLTWVCCGLDTSLIVLPFSDGMQGHLKESMVQAKGSSEG